MVRLDGMTTRLIGFSFVLQYDACACRQRHHSCEHGGRPIDHHVREQLIETMRAAYKKFAGSGTAECHALLFMDTSMSRRATRR
jgi:hypothetical protein